MQTLYDGSNGTRIVHAGEPDETESLLSVLMQVSDELCWQPGSQLYVCMAAAQHLAVMVNHNVVGGLQVVYGSCIAALPYREVWPEVSFPDQAVVAHVTILALAKEYRGHPHLFGSLCVELWRCCVAKGIEQIVIEATPQTLRLYRRIGWPLEIIGDLRPHWGEDCYLCRMGVREIAEALLEKAGRSASHRALVEQAYRDNPYVLPLTDTACV